MEEEIENFEPSDKKAARAFRTIAEVSAELNVPQHVLRFWEKKFPEVSPVQRVGGRRYYRPEDIDLLKKIEYLLHKEGYTIKGVQKLLKEGTINAVIDRQNTMDEEIPEKTMTSDDKAEKRDSAPELDNIIIELEEISALLKKAV